MKDQKFIDLNEFSDEGFLQEANRKFFHPLGLAMVVIVGDDGNAEFLGIGDWRDDPEGGLFAPGVLSREKAENVEKLRASKLKIRIETGQCDGTGIQVIGEQQSNT